MECKSIAADDMASPRKNRQRRKNASLAVQSLLHAVHVSLPRLAFHRFVRRAFFLARSLCIPARPRREFTILPLPNGQRRAILQAVIYKAETEKSSPGRAALRECASSAESARGRRPGEVRSRVSALNGLPLGADGRPRYRAERPRFQTRRIRVVPRFF